MNNEDLDAIEARANAATKGPWYHRGSLTEEEVGILGGTEASIVTENDEPDDGYTFDLFASWRDDGIDDADAAFIAASREDVPAMAAEIRRLWAMFDAWKKGMGGD